MYYKNAKAALVVYDITKKESFERAKYWISELNENADADIVIALVANKIDLEDQRKVDKDEAELFAK